MRRGRWLSMVFLSGVASAAVPVAGGVVRGQVTIALRGKAKADRSGVVVFVADQPLPVGPRPSASMKQAESQFSPQVLAVPVGTEVRFPNADVIEHNVFSRSPHATFDLGRYGNGPGKTHTFDQAGVVDVYCNVHPKMIGHVVVVPGPFAISGPDGRFEIRGVTPGPHQLVFWDRLGAPAITRQTVQVPDHGEATIEAPLAEGDDQEPPHPNKFGGAYRGSGY